MTIDLRDFDAREHPVPTLRDPDTLLPLDADLADYIRAALCRQRYLREAAHKPPRENAR